MKLAVIDPVLNKGGGIRFLKNLIFTIHKNFPSIELCLYFDIKNKSNHDVVSFFVNNGIKIKNLESFKLKTQSTKVIKRAFLYFKKKIYRNKILDFHTALKNEIEQISNEFDLIYFPWPYFIDSPLTSCPKVGTFHDFNFRYFFGSNIFSNEETIMIDRSIKNFLIDTFPIVSTVFMRNELIKFYQPANQPAVIHLPSLNFFKEKEISIDVNNLSYNHIFLKNYIVCPVHLTAHKNIGNIIAAATLVNANKTFCRFIFTGSGTECLNGQSSYLSLEKRMSYSDDFDIVGLGYISDEEMNYLIRNANAVLNASFYEAGNGVGLDAWALGVPVIQSRIPSFDEHIELQGFKAFTFDPRNPRDIADQIIECLSNQELCNYYVNASLIASKKLTWDITAHQYVKIFEQILNS